MGNLFQSLCRIGIHELQRTGSRSSFQPKHILHMVEKFAASDIQGSNAIELYHLAGVCLAKKGDNETCLIEQLKTGRFGFSSSRPLVWLWRFSSRQRKEVPSASVKYNSIEWIEMFDDPTKPLVVDVGSGMGASILNLATLSDNVVGTEDNVFDPDGALLMPWSDCNYAGTELNPTLVNFGNGIISRDIATSRRKGRVHISCLPAEEFLKQLERYPGGIALIMINFPSPYRLQLRTGGNSQLPLIDSGQFMVTKKVLQSISSLLSKSYRGGYFLFQTKCEDVAVYVKQKCLDLGTLHCIPCKNPVSDIDSQYNDKGKTPKRVDEWIKTQSNPERAVGAIYSATPILPAAGQPETEAQCQLDGTVIHRCMFRLKT